MRCLSFFKDPKSSSVYACIYVKSRSAAGLPEVTITSRWMWGNYIENATTTQRGEKNWRKMSVWDRSIGNYCNAPYTVVHRVRKRYVCAGLNECQHMNLSSLHDTYFALIYMLWKRIFAFNHS